MLFDHHATSNDPSNLVFAFIFSMFQINYRKLSTKLTVIRVCCILLNYPGAHDVVAPHPCQLYDRQRRRRHGAGMR